MALTKVLLTATAMEVDPDLPGAVVANTRILLIVKSVQSSTHCVVQLRGEKREGRGRPFHYLSDEYTQQGVKERQRDRRPADRVQ